MNSKLSRLLAPVVMLFFLTSISPKAFADKFIKATVLYKDDTKMDGFVDAKITSNKDETVKFKLTQESKPSKLDANQIDQIIFYTATHEIILAYRNLIFVNRLSGKYVNAKRPGWLHVLESCNELVLYEQFYSFDVSRSKIYLVYPDARDIPIYASKPGEDTATVLAILLSTIYKDQSWRGKGTNKVLKKLLKTYFGEYPQAVEIIEADKLRISYNVIVDVFNSICPSEKFK